MSQIPAFGNSHHPAFDTGEALHPGEHAQFPEAQVNADYRVTLSLTLTVQIAYNQDFIRSTENCNRFNTFDKAFAGKLRPVQILAGIRLAFREQQRLMFVREDKTFPDITSFSASLREPSKIILTTPREKSA